MQARATYRAGEGITPCRPTPRPFWFQGRVYLTSYEANAALRRDSQGRFETLVKDPRALGPDTLGLARDRRLYFAADQLHRQPAYHNGKDLREKPYPLFRIKVDARPVLLRRSGEQGDDARDRQDGER